MVKFCTECGYKNEDISKFCVNCGHPFKNMDTLNSEDENNEDLHKSNINNESLGKEESKTDKPKELIDTEELVVDEKEDSEGTVDLNNESDESKKSGDIDELIDGAGKAAEVINKINDKTAFGLIVSCVGRKIVMKQLIDDEVEIIQNTLGENVLLSGFYSYGEFAPFQDNLLNCELHNQTMTLTTIYES